MHDWYKAGFFFPELEVKKLEDADYEPLAQLIHRIGNSREPFLTPHTGILHGSAVVATSSTASAPEAVPATIPSTIQASSAQSSFASSFERRKQDEQYLMTRQKEHLAQQPVMIKQMHNMQDRSHELHSQQLHHYSSAHSLQSQPSYGTSPTDYQSSPVKSSVQPPAVVSGFFDAIPRDIGHSLGPLGGSSATLSSVREDKVPGIMDQIHAGHAGQGPHRSPSYTARQQEGLNHSQQVAALLTEKSRLQRREPDHLDMLWRNSDDLRGTAGRLKQFLALSELMQKAVVMANQGPAILLAPVAQMLTVPTAKVLLAPIAQMLPAPAVQKNRQNVADATADSQSQFQTFMVDSPTAAIAPWAKANTHTHSSKGTSLKETKAENQAMEAAQQGEVVVAARQAIVDLQEH